MLNLRKPVGLMLKLSIHKISRGLIYGSFDPEPRFMSGATKHDVVDSIAAASSLIGRSPGGNSRHRGICQNEEKENPAASVLLHPTLRVGDGCFVASMGHKGWMVRQVRQTLTPDAKGGCTTILKLQ